MIAMIGGVVMKVDIDLVARASNGDKDAFSDLYYSCYKDLYKFDLLCRIRLKKNSRGYPFP